MIRHRRAGTSFLAMLLASAAILAGPATVARAAGLQVTTPYPAVTVDPGGSVTFPLTITTPSPTRVSLSVTTAPSGWTTALRGGGNIVDAVYTGSPAPAVDLAVTLPPSVQPGTYTVVLRATSSAGNATLPLDLVVAGSSSGGGVSMTSDFPSLKGAPSASFSFDVTLHNDTAQKLTFGLDTAGPTGWQVNASPTGQTQAQSTAVAAGSTADITVSVTPASDASAGTYPVAVRATSGSYQAQAQLQVQITGTATLTLTTTDGRLNTQVTAGSSSTLTVVVQNTGTAPAENVTLSATPPSNWKVTFDQPTIATLAPQQKKNVVATITPANDAVAGDYDLTISASGGGSSPSMDIRAAVQTSPLWGFVGILLIVVVLAGIGWVFRRYGRR